MLSVELRNYQDSLDSIFSVVGPSRANVALTFKANSDLSEVTHPRKGHTRHENPDFAARRPLAARSALCRSRYNAIQSRAGAPSLES